MDASAAQSSMCAKSTPAQLSDIEVVYRSQDFLVVNKHYDVRINSDDPTHNITVETQLRHLHPELVDHKVEHGFRFVHRLDYATSGLLCLALSAKGAQLASTVFQKRRAGKHYLALVRGHFEPEYGMIDVAIGEDLNSRARGVHSMCPAATSSGHCHKARPAATQVLLLEHGMYEDKPASKLLLIPVTGRSHQLRVHCACIGHVIVGDYTYSQQQDTTPYRMMLHARTLILPMTGEHIDICTHDPFTRDTDTNWLPQRTFRTYDQCIEDLKKSPQMCDQHVLKMNKVW